MGLFTSGVVTKVLVTSGLTAGIIISTAAFNGDAALEGMKHKADEASQKIQELVSKTQGWQSYAVGLQDNFTSTVNNANSQIGALKNKNSELQATIKGLDKKLKAANARIATLEVEKAKLIADREALRIALSIKTAQYNAEVEAHKNTKSTLQAEIESLKQQISDLSSQISSLEATITDLSNAKSELESQITALNTQKAELEDKLLVLEDQNKQLNDLNEQANGEIDRLEGELNEANTTGQNEINRLEAEVNKANSAVEGAANYVNGVDISGSGAKDVSEVSDYTPPALDTAPPVNSLTGAEGTDEAPAASEALTD